MTKKTLDAKLAAIRAGSYKSTDFIIADAKDGDIGFGAAAPGPEPADPTRPKPRAAHLQAIREMTRSGLVDIMLLSASTCERLSEEGLFREKLGHAGDPPERHHRHLVGARLTLQGGAVAPPSDRAARPGEEACRPRTLFDHLLQPARYRRRERRGVFGLPRRGRRPTSSGTSWRCSIRPSTSA